MRTDELTLFEEIHLLGMVHYFTAPRLGLCPYFEKEQETWFYLLQRKS